MNKINYGSINNLRNFLEFKIKNIDELKEDIIDIDFKVDVLEYLLELLKDPSNNKFDISLNLELIYSPKEVDRTMKLISFISNIERKGIPDDFQYKNLMGSLNVLINKIKIQFIIPISSSSKAIGMGVSAHNSAISSHCLTAIGCSIE